ncbi:hypothetical protein [Candidatus Binatus sp.]|uniref:hypothetical protein n=1 Tax=Candidatus Binatus sp. TaxID=2811406 RepID=UPI003CC6CE4E
MQRSLDSPANVEPRTLRRGARPPVAAAQADRARNLSRKEIHLRLNLRSPLPIPYFLRVFQSLAEFNQPPFVIPLRLNVQHLSSIAGTANSQARVSSFDVCWNEFGAGSVQQIKRVKFLLRMLQQAMYIREPL